MNSVIGQIELDLGPITQVEGMSKNGIDESFLAFHSANEHVYRNLRALALQARQAGRKRIGMKFLFERLRWEYAIKTTHDEGDFRLNNNLTSRYSRLIMEQEPELAGFFETRELRG